MSLRKSQSLRLERLCAIRITSPDAIGLYQRSFIVSYRHHIKRYDMFSGEYLQSFKGHTNTVRSLFVWHEFLFSSGLEGQLLQWHIPTGQLVGRFHGQPNIARRFRVVEDQWLYTLHDEHQLLQWSLKTQRLLRCQTLNTSATLSSSEVRFLEDTGSLFDLQPQGLFRYCVLTGQCVRVGDKPERLLSPLVSLEATGNVLWGATRHSVWQGELQEGSSRAQLLTETPVPDIVGLSQRTLFRYVKNRLYVYQVWDQRFLAQVLPDLYEALWELVCSYVF